MKIEFRKVLFPKKEFKLCYNSVYFEGNFCRISSGLVEINATLFGKIGLNCDRCYNKIDFILDENINFLVSDGIYSKEDDKVIIELEYGLIDFEYLIQSEIESIKSEYRICKNCEISNNLIQQEF
jgi:hypothetical protein